MVIATEFPVVQRWLVVFSDGSTTDVVVEKRSFGYGAHEVAEEPYCAGHSPAAALGAWVDWAETPPAEGSGEWVHVVEMRRIEQPPETAQAAALATNESSER